MGLRCCQLFHLCDNHIPRETELKGCRSYIQLGTHVVLRSARKRPCSANIPCHGKSPRRCPLHGCDLETCCGRAVLMWLCFGSVGTKAVRNWISVGLPMRNLFMSMQGVTMRYSWLAGCCLKSEQPNRNRSNTNQVDRNSAKHTGINPTSPNPALYLAQCNFVKIETTQQRLHKHGFELLGRHSSAFPATVPAKAKRQTPGPGRQLTEASSMVGGIKSNEDEAAKELSGLS